MITSASSLIRDINLSAGTIVDQAEFFGLQGIYESAGKQEVSCAFFADLAGEKDRDDGEETDFTGVAELSFRDSDGEIAERGDAAASGPRAWRSRRR